LPNTAGRLHPCNGSSGPHQEILGDRNAALSQLWIQLHRNLSDRRAAPGQEPAHGVRRLQVHPLVLPDLLAQTDRFGAQPELSLLLRLVVAAGLAGILGWEREFAHKPAGLRTHMVVGIAAALFTVLGELAMSDSPAGAVGPRPDPIRVIQAVAVGIGFLGSGIIFVAKEGDRVLGLTTAASIWATAGVGLAAGTGRYLLAAGSTGLLLLVLRGMARFDRER
jgi:putative Mg2+ transporter-C (MgtC) family protein